jgi:trehalose 6-phosphate phosphatase
MTFADLLSPACALFLDFDGTLVDIAPEPGAVTVPSSLVPTLGALHGYLGGAVAVVSGRPIAEIDQFLAPLRLATAGIHGAERRSAAGELVRIDSLPLQVVEAAARRWPPAIPRCWSNTSTHRSPSTTVARRSSRPRASKPCSKPSTARPA